MKHQHLMLINPNRGKKKNPVPLMNQSKNPKKKLKGNLVQMMIKLKQRKEN